MSFHDGHYSACIEGFKDAGGHVQYCIKVRHRSDLSWTVWRRFSDFSCHHDELIAESRSEQEQHQLPQLPEKSWLPAFTQSMVAEFCEQRQRDLQIYLEAILADPVFRDRRPFLAFLGVRPPDPPAGLRVVPRQSGLELEVRPPCDEPWQAVEDAGECESSEAPPVDGYFIDIVSVESGCRHTLRREVGSTGRQLQRAQVGSLEAGSHRFEVRAFNGTGCSSVVSITIDPLHPSLQSGQASPEQEAEAGASERRVSITHDSYPCSDEWQEKATSRGLEVSYAREVHVACHAQPQNSQAELAFPAPSRSLQQQHYSEQNQQQLSGQQRNFHRTDAFLSQQGQSQPMLLQSHIQGQPLIRCEQPHAHLSRPPGQQAHRSQRERTQTQPQPLSQSERRPNCYMPRYPQAAATTPSLGPRPLLQSACDSRVPQSTSNIVKFRPCDGTHMEKAISSTPNHDTSEFDEDLMCVVCLDAKKTHAFVPCGHQCVCADCAHGLLPRRSGDATCPVCRASVSNVIQIFS
eukprot:TRINITY_DN4982_c2_g1_i1.p1 TRINITY_DN4982_c2_g1~~TRINITY_DN4982_c2_g1_i1.p1  ORF type:complete len:519 (-),score=40.76 TRINITY_DN4982_c2_g1_i1:52-1608(-)